MRCTRRGCGVELAANADTAVCSFHPGTPVFHEGLKSWSCCQDVNKPVLDFDDFMKIPGCEEIVGHTAAVQPSPAPETPAAAAPPAPSHVGEDGKEHFGVKPATGNDAPTLHDLQPQTDEVIHKAAPVLELDDVNTRVSPGTLCRRKGCGVAFVSDEVNRFGDGEGTVCHYHPLPPIFREGSKGYLCCKRRVLEFDEFLKIKGCGTGRHCFVPVVTEPQTEEQVTCRIDHYQTQTQVHVSVFGKQVDKERSSVVFGSNEVALDLYLPGKKRFTKSLDLFGQIDPAQSTYQILGTKVELHLQKADGKSWVVLEKTTRDLGGIALTFGVGGRTGTVGGKDVILDDNNKARNG